ncbi:MAG: hypothetical protein EZS28_044465 [Streblomastix strix]|uniref:Uncharacterized protein n=1 Tax=Streblomastix strix TaxID=222440 RepID=A0A5J4TNY2_9EUKA|nr:MAG: hypothetical protein EZS28_044465 [Streblomastix strix]
MGEVTLNDLDIMSFLAFFGQKGQETKSIKKNKIGRGHGHQSIPLVGNSGFLVNCTDKGIAPGNDVIPAEEVIIPEEIAPIIKYNSLGFKFKFTINQDAVPMWQRTDGEIDPLRNASFLSESQLELSEKAQVLKDEFFKDDDYAFYGPDNSYNFIYYPDVSYVNNKPKFLFYNKGMDPYIGYSTLPYTFVDGIVSNNTTSYVINAKYVFRTTSIQVGFLSLFSALYHDDTLPYRVYFSEDYIFLMSKEDSFSKKYLEKFTPDNGILKNRISSCYVGSKIRFNYYIAISLDPI